MSFTRTRRRRSVFVDESNHRADTSSCRTVSAALRIALGLALCAPLARAQSMSPDNGGYRPHYQGYGVGTPGGRGGRIVKVTNLNDNGAGSLRDALDPAVCGPRVVVFEISGTIPLNYPLMLTCPFITIAGQTAPSPGILIRNRSLFVDTHDVVIQHLRFRMGDTANQEPEDTIYLRNGVYNVVLDHLSLSWGTHENLGVNAFTGPQPTEVAVLDSIIAEGLAKPLNPGGVGNLFYASAGSTATVARNLYANQGNRNPWIGPGWQFAGYNNVAYNPYGVAGDYDTYGFWQFQATGYPITTPFDIVWTSNVALPGPNTHPDVRPVKIALDPTQAVSNFRVLLTDNTGPYMTLSSQWSGVTYHDSASEGAVRATVAPARYTRFNFVVLPNADVLAHVLSGAGARPLDRDSVDQRIVAGVSAHGGAIIRTQNDVGGFPVLAVNYRAYTPPLNPNLTAPGQLFRTNLELDLERLAQSLESTPLAQTTAVVQVPDPVSAAAPAVPLTNGGFEGGFTGWNTSGNLEVGSGGFWKSTEGAKTVAFNGGQSLPNGVLSQTFATQRGQQYALTFDAGAQSGLNRNEQRLFVVVRGRLTTPLLQQLVSVFPPAGGGTKYAAQSFVFTADGASTTLTFRDQSYNHDERGSAA